MPVDVTVKADHFQILVGDRAQGPLVDTSGLWDSEGPIPSVDGIRALIALPIARFGGTVHVEIDICSERPPSGLSPWEDLGSFEIDVPSGELLLWGPETLDMAEAASVRVPAGSFRGQALALNANQLTDELASDGPDRYRLVLWPAPTPSRTT
jgi:hypothetical protein